MRYLFFIFFFLGFSLLQAKDIVITHDVRKIVLSKIDSFDHVEYTGVLNGAQLATKPGMPDLPVYIYRVVLQPGQTIRSFKITGVDQTELSGTFNIEPCAKPWTQESTRTFVPPDPAVYQSTNPYPQVVVKYLGVQHFNGRPVAHFAVYPFQYIPAHKKLFFNQSITIAYETGNSQTKSVQPLLQTDSAPVNNLLGHQTGNRLMTKLPLPEPTDAIDPALLSSGLIDRYVIITTDKLKAAFEPLAEWKTQRGVPTVIRTLGWIRSHFPNATDDAERMRDFIRWAYQKRGTRYVLLGGDTEIIPTRLIHTGDFTFAADYYFADLDGSWNANQNDIFGQAADAVEAYPEVYVGRVPVLQPDDVQRFIYKLFRYEKLDSVHTPGYPANALYLAANLQKVDDSRDLIMKHIDPQINPKFARTLLTQSRDIGSDPQVPLNALNQGYGIVFSENHGLYFTIRPGAKGSDLYNYQIKNLTTPDPPIWYMASCYTNDILKRSISEVYMRSKTGGGVAYIGNSSWEYPFSGIYLEKEFFNLAFNKGYYHLSEAHYLSRLPYLGYLNFEGPSRIIVFSTIVLGDPEMPIWTDRVKNCKVVWKLREERNKQLLWVDVTEADSSALPIAGANVVLYKKGKLYRILRTDNSGEVNFDVTGVNLDRVWLTVAKHNYRPWQDTINVHTASGFAPQLSGFQFVQIKGNNNNQAEPGEQFDLYVTWKNTGTMVIPRESAVIVRNDTPYFTFKNTEFYLSRDLEAGDSIKAGPFTFSLGTNIPDDTTLVITTQLGTQTGYALKKTIEFNVFVPHLIVNRQEWATLATGDSLTSENITMIIPSLQNTGLGMATNIFARLVSDDSLVTLVKDTLFMAGLAPGQTNAFDEGFVIKTKQSLSEIRLKAIYSDRSGLQWSFPVDFVQPDPPAGLNFRTDNERGILLTWQPDSDQSILGYNIYRSENPRKAFVKITETPIPLAGYFVDNGIRTGQSYYYALQAVDSSGNLSALSDTLHAWAALPYQQGFPVRPNVKAIGSEVSGVTCFDFNGDGKKELIASGGNGQLHVYDDRGNLLFAGGEMVGDLTYPAVGNVTGDATKEIVVSGFREGEPENNIYVIDSRNGNILSRFDLHYNVPSPVVLADLDHDGLDEILVLTHGANAPTPPKESRLFILRDSSGVLVGFKNWPTAGLPFSGDNTSLGNVAVADLDNSGMMSVIVPTLRSKLYCFDPDTSTNPVWVTTLPGGYLMAPVSVADLNNDGFKEMVVASVKNDKLYVIDHTGAVFPGWEGGKDVQITDPYAHSSPAIIGNVDDDPDLEIIYVGRHNIYVFDADGSLKDGWPMPIDNGGGYYENDREKLPPYNSPVLGDVNQDGVQDLVYLDAYGFIRAISLDDRHELTGFPIFTNNDRVNAQSPVLDDIDGDGDLDILTVNHEGILMVWDAPQKYDKKTFLFWNQPLANPAHTGELDTLRLAVISGIQKDSQVNLPQRFYLRPNYPNPFNPQTTIEFGLKEAATVRLTVFNLLGQKVVTLYNDRLLSKGSYRVRWNGKNAFGRDVASGIYFLRLTVKDRMSGQIRFMKTNKMIKLK